MTTMTKDHTITMTQEVQAPAAKVFDAISKPEQVEKWFASSAEGHPVEGSSYSYDFRFKDPEKASKADHARQGKFTKMVPGKQLSYTWLGKQLLTSGWRQRMGKQL